jgi:hypothetical protein
MNPKSKEEYLKVFEEKSVILNPPPNDKKQFPRVSKPIFGIGGMKVELENILDEEVNELGQHMGQLAHARAMAKEARQKWKKYKKSQPDMPKNAKPIDHWADEINYWDAKVLVLEAEARELNKLIREAEEKERKQNIKRIPKNGACKLIDGRIAKCDGRPVVQQNGKNIFSDDGSSVDAYIKEVKIRRLERARNKTLMKAVSKG